MASKNKNTREVWSGLTGRQVALAHELEELTEDFGPFAPQGVDGLGYQGPATNTLGILCGCCVFWDQSGECELSEQPVDQKGGCRLGIVPATMVAGSPIPDDGGMMSRNRHLLGGVESRAEQQRIELREIVSQDLPTIVGYAAVFNSMSEDLGGFREVIRPGAFASALTSSDVRALINHDKNQILGRNKAGTLKLFEDARGLRYEITPPDTQYARDLIKSIQRGDISGSSFRFYMPADPNQGQAWRSEPSGVVREISSFASIDDVSVVTYPAYPATDAGLRSLNQWRLSQTRPDHPDNVRMALRLAQAQ